MSSERTVLLMRLAGPLQSWGIASRNNRRDTSPTPTKSGILGLLAAAEGRPRDADITDLLGLRLGVRTDQPGSLLHDYHTASDYRGVPLLSAAVTATGAQKPTSPKKYTHVTHRYYLQDAVFLAAVAGPAPTIEALHRAVTNPVFPLALGRRSCIPTGPLVVSVCAGGLLQTLQDAPWQAGGPAKDGYAHSSIRLPVSLDADEDDRETLGAAPELHQEVDVPTSFDPRRRGLTERTVAHVWVTVPTGKQDAARAARHTHDPFALLGGW